jgi:hypothetical protein
VFVAAVVGSSFVPAVAVAQQPLDAAAQESQRIEVADPVTDERPDPLRVFQLAGGALAGALTLALVAQRKLRHIKVRVYR